MGYSTNSKTTESNARLRAAAPEILDALGTALGLITKHGLAVRLAQSEPEDYDRLITARYHHRTAIAKATAQENRTMTTTYPVFDTARMDCDRETLATGSIGQAATEAEARAMIQTSHDAADWMGAPPPKVARVECAERFGVWGWFPADEA